MSCLRDLASLFGRKDPFYAGFGNRITDALSYRSVGVPPSRIFTIDYTSEVKMELLEFTGYKSSYVHLTDLVDHFFPPLNMAVFGEYTDFLFWRQTPPPLSDEDEDYEKDENNIDDDYNDYDEEVDSEDDDLEEDDETITDTEEGAEDEFEYNEEGMNANTEKESDQDQEAQLNVNNEKGQNLSQSCEDFERLGMKETA